MKTKVINREKLTQITNEGISTLSKKYPQIVVAVAVRAVMNNETGKKESLEFEFLQQRTLGGRRLNVLGLLNLGDTRFSAGDIKMRVWSIVSREGAISTLGFTEEQVDSLIKQSQEIGEDDRIALLKPIEVINTSEGPKEIKIICRESNDFDTLPERIKSQLDTEYADRYILQAPTGEDGELEKVVDENGATVYRWFELGLKDQEDTIVPNKLSMSNYLKTGSTEARSMSSADMSEAFGLTP